MSQKTGLILLSGGQGRRMGGQDKGWCLYQNQPFVEIVLHQLQLQIEQLGSTQFTVVISANRNLDKYQRLDKNVSVVTDVRSEFCGPLAGIEAAMRAFKDADITRWITYPVDSLEVPKDYIETMLSVEPQQVGYLQQNGKKHFAHLTIPNTHLASLSHYLDRGERSIKGWLHNFDCVQEVECLEHPNTLLNLNSELD